MSHTLPDLPFASDALEPWMSPETFSYHHGKHHATYVKNLNNLLEGNALADASLEDIVCKSEGGMFNNAAQHYNHSFFWNCLRPAGGDGPSGDFLAAINSSFGSLESFQEQFTKAAATLFGSGWAWLVKKSDGSLAISAMSNAGCPLTEGDTPLLTADVWEHAYYVDHRNARPVYLAGFWSHANWEFATANWAG